jgi:hypothetical protein
VEQVTLHQLVLRKEIQVVQQLTELAQEVAVVVEQVLPELQLQDL